MNSAEGALDFEMLLKDERFRAAIARNVQELQKIGMTAQQEGGKLDSMFSKLGTLAAGYFGLQGITTFTQQVVKTRGEFQQIEVAMNTILGSREKANALMTQMVELAAKTPFTLQDVATGAKQLLSYGTSAEKITDTLRRLGDVAAGVSAPLNDLVYLYGTAQTQGRIYTRDVMQFAQRGIPIYRELANVMNITEKQVKDYVEEGKVGFEQIEQVFKNLTSKGGMFFNLMEAQSKTVTGQMSNLRDAISMMFNKIGESSEGAITNTISGLKYLVENYETVGKILLTLVATYGTYKATLIAVAAYEQAKRLYEMANGAWKAAQAFGALTNMTRAQILAQTALNATNPVGWIAILVGLVTTAASMYAIWGGHTTALSEATKKFNEQVSAERSELETLFSIAKNSTEGTKEHTQAIEEITTKYRTYLPNIDEEIQKQGGLVDVYHRLNDAIEANIAMKYKESATQAARTTYEEKLKGISDDTLKDIDRYYSKTGQAEEKTGEYLAKRGQYIAKVQEYARKYVAAEREIERINTDTTLSEAQRSKKRIDQLALQNYYHSKSNDLMREAVSDSGSAMRLNAIFDAAQEYERTIQSANEVFVSAQKSIQQTAKGVKFNVDTASLGQLDEQLEALNKRTAALTADEKKQQQAIVGRIKAEETKLSTIETVEARIKSLRDKAGQYAKNDPEYVAIQARINALSKKLPSKKEGAAATPYGTIEYWEKVRSNAESAMKALDPRSRNYEAEVQRQIEKMQQAQDEIDRLQFNTKPIEDQIAYQKGQYELYYKWVAQYGEEVAGQQFSSLISNGKTFEQYLTNLDEKLTQQIEEGADDPNKATTISSVREKQIIVRTTIEGLGTFETGMERFRATLVTAQKDSRNLTAYLDILKAKQKALGSDFTPLGMAKKELLTSEIAQAEERLNGIFAGILTSSEEFNARYSAITNEFAKQRQELARRAGENIPGSPTVSVGDVERMMTEIERAENAAFARLNKDVVAYGKGLEAVIGDIGEFAQNLAGSVVIDIREMINLPQYKAVKDDVLTLLSTADNAFAEKGMGWLNIWQDNMSRVSGLMIELGGDAARLGETLNSAVQAVTDDQTKDVGFGVKVVADIDAATRAIETLKASLPKDSPLAISPDVQRLQEAIALVERFSANPVELSVEGNTEALINALNLIQGEVAREGGVFVDVKANTQEAADAIAEIDATLKADRSLTIHTNVDKFNEDISKARAAINAISAMLPVDGSVNVADGTAEVREAIESIRQMLADPQSLAVEGNIDMLTAAIKQVQESIASGGVLPIEVTADVTDAKAKLSALRASIPSGGPLLITPQTEVAMQAIKALSDELPVEGVVTTKADTEAAQKALEDVRAGLPDDRVITITTQTGDAIQALDAVSAKLPIEGTVTAKAETEEARKALEEVNAAMPHDRNIAITTQTGEALEALKALSDMLPIEGSANVTPQTEVARKRIEEIIELLSNPRQLNVEGNTDNLRSNIDELLKMIPEHQGIELSVDAKVASDTISSFFASMDEAADPAIVGTDLLDQLKGISHAFIDRLNQQQREIGLQERVNDLMKEYQTATQRRKAIDDQYLEDRTDIEHAIQNAVKNGDAVTAARLRETMKAREEAYYDDAEAFETSLSQEGNYFEKFIQVSRDLGRAKLKEDIGNIQTRLQAAIAAYGEESEEVQILKGQLEGANMALLVGDMEKVAYLTEGAAQYMGQFDDELSQSLTEASQLASTLSGIEVASATKDIGSLIGLLMKANGMMNSIINDNLKGNERLVASFAAGGLPGLFSTLAFNKKERREQEAAYFKSIAAEAEMAALARQRFLDSKSANTETISQVQELIAATIIANDLAVAQYANLMSVLQTSTGMATATFDEFEAKYNAGTLGEKEIPVFEQLKQLKQELEGYGSSFEDLMNQVQEMMLGVSAQSLGDEIMSAFEQGKTSMDDFEASFDKMIKRMLYRQLRNQLLQPIIDKLAEQLSAYDFTAYNAGTGRMLPGRGGVVGNQLTPEEFITAANNAWMQANEQIAAQVRALETVTGFDLTGDPALNSLQGAIKGVTEETAGIVAGQLNAMRINQGQSLDIIRQQLLSLNNIEAYTKRLINIEKVLSKPPELITNRALSTQ